MRASRACCGGPTASETKDYYAVLGLDRDASAESIKLAYRRLARENHPDLAQHRGAEVVAQSAAVMTVLNEAYAVLSHSRSRREYDAASLRATNPEAVSVAPVEEVVHRAAAAPARARVGVEMLSSVVTVFSEQLRKTITAGTAGFKWHEKSMEGFDWMLHASFWNAGYYVGVRGFATGDMAAAAKFVNYCDLATARSKSMLKPAYCLFFFLFQKLSGGDNVAAFLRRFCANQDGQRTPGPVRIVMMDATHGRALVCGPAISDARYEHLVKRLAADHAR